MNNLNTSCAKSVIKSKKKTTLLLGSTFKLPSLIWRRLAAFWTSRRSSLPRLMETPEEITDNKFFSTVPLNGRDRLKWLTWIFLWVNCDFDFPTGSLTLDYLGLRQHGREVKISATKALRKKQKLPKKQNKTKYKKQNTRHKIQNFSTCVRSGDSDGIARWRRLKSGEANPWWLVWGWEKRSSKYYIFIHVPDIYTKKRKWKVHIIWNPGNTLPPPLYAYA